MRSWRHFAVPHTRAWDTYVRKENPSACALGPDQSGERSHARLVVAAARSTVLVLECLPWIFDARSGPDA